MNYVMIRYLIGWMLGVEAIFLLLPALTAVLYQEPVVLPGICRAVLPQKTGEHPFLCA